MKIIALIHMFPPVHNAGGETTALSFFRSLVNRGHSVTVLCRPHTEESQFEDYEIDGVTVKRVKSRAPDDQSWMRLFIRDFNPDLMVTHLDLTFQAMQIALDLDLPLVHLVHNSMQLKHHRVGVHRCQLAVFNSQWVADAEDWKGPQVVIHPVVEPEYYRCKRGTKVTLVNPTPNKGADTFYGASKLLPDLEFLVVKSVYGEQIAVPNIPAHLHPNVETMEHVPDARQYLEKTKVILMPSDYESYGRAAVEAACAGIPAIVHPTEGLLEALGADRPDWIIEFTRERQRDFKLKRRTPTPEQLKGGWVSGAGIFCDRDDLPSWQAQIQRLYTDEIYYRSRSDAALKLANSLNPEGEFDRFEMALVKCHQDRLKEREELIVKTWTSDRRLWETSEGKLIPEVNGRIPQNAIRMAAGIGTEIPEDVAIANGLIPDPNPAQEAPEEKAFAAPVENKAIESPAETKTKRKKKTA